MSRRPMSRADLSPTSYLVLGMVAGLGPVTPYDLKQWVNLSLGYFWSFPHSQLYAEPDRLVGLGLLDVEQEEGGRRRKRYTATDAGRSALLDWLREPTSDVGELRSPGLLKLFFAAQLTTDEVAALARAQADAHRERLEAFRTIEASIAGQEGMEFPYATLRLGIADAVASLAFWEEIAEDPPRTRR